MMKFLILFARILKAYQEELILYVIEFCYLDILMN